MRFPAMSIWGKIIGGAAGFALGGPIGALLGVAAGHVVDRARRAPGRVGRDPMAAKRIAFTVALIALGAKMAKADGVVTRDEIEAFKRAFRIPPEEAAQVGKIFNEARREATGFEPYAEQIAQLFRHNQVVLEGLIDGLFHIALADDVLHKAELEFLRAVAAIFGMDEHRFESIRARHMTGREADPYEVLGVASEASDEEIKKVYYELTREHHPDRLIAQGMPQEFIDVATEKMAAINGAYDRIQRQRGLN